MEAPAHPPTSAREQFVCAASSAEKPAGPFLAAEVLARVHRSRQGEPGQAAMVPQQRAKSVGTKEHEAGRQKKGLLRLRDGRRERRTPRRQVQIYGGWMSPDPARVAAQQLRPLAAARRFPPPVHADDPGALGPSFLPTRTERSPARGWRPLSRSTATITPSSMTYFVLWRRPKDTISPSGICVRRTIPWSLLRRPCS